MKALILFSLMAIVGTASAKPEPFIQCMSASPHVKTIDIYTVNFKDVPDIYVGTLPACTFIPSPNGSTVAEFVYPVKGSTIAGSDGRLVTFWTAAVVVDENEKATIFYQYSDFVARSVTLQDPTPCTQGLFISDAKQILDFRSNEPGRGMGRARLNGEEVVMGCQSK
jgi:hypothetical protein